MSYNLICPSDIPAPKMFGCHQDNILHKQIEYIKEMTFANVSAVDIKDIIDSLSCRVKAFVESIKNAKPHHSWLRAGWYVPQKGALHNIFQCKETIMCFSCNELYNDVTDICNMKYCYIISEFKIPEYMRKKMIRAYIICNKCASDSPYPPPTTWQDAMAMSVYKHHMKHHNSFLLSTTETKVIDELKVNLFDVGSQKNALEIELKTSTEELGKIQCKFDKYKETISSKNEQLCDMIQNSVTMIQNLKTEKDAINLQVKAVEQDIVNEKNALLSSIDKFKNRLTSELDGMSSVIDKSSLGNFGKNIITDSDTCQVCYDNSINIILDPCGHYVMCEDCSTLVGNSCPICRGVINKSLKVFKV